MHIKYLYITPLEQIHNFIDSASIRYIFAKYNKGTMETEYEKIDWLSVLTDKGRTKELNKLREDAYRQVRESAEYVEVISEISSPTFNINNTKKLDDLMKKLVAKAEALELTWSMEYNQSNADIDISDKDMSMFNEKGILNAEAIQRIAYKLNSDKVLTDNEKKVLEDIKIKKAVEEFQKALDDRFDPVKKSAEAVETPTEVKKADFVEKGMGNQDNSFTVESFAFDIVNGVQHTSKEAQQFYDNNKEAIEKELLKLKKSEEASDILIDIEKRRQEELSNLGRKQIEKSINILKEATSVKIISTETRRIEKNIEVGAKITKEEKIILGKKKQELEEQGYEVIELVGKIYHPGMNLTPIFQFVDNNTTLTKYQINLVEKKLEDNKKIGIKKDVEIIINDIVPQVNKDGKMVQSAKVRVLSIDDKDIEQIIKGSKDGKSNTTKFDRINAEYDAEIAALEDNNFTEKTTEKKKAKEIVLPTVKPNIELDNQKFIRSKINKHFKDAPEALKEKILIIINGRLKESFGDTLFEDKINSRVLKSNFTKLVNATYRQVTGVSTPETKAEEVIEDIVVAEPKTKPTTINIEGSTSDVIQGVHVIDKQYSDNISKILDNSNRDVKNLPIFADNMISKLKNINCK